jgi:ABC-2 type transport system ATP-binding protein
LVLQARLYGIGKAEAQQRAERALAAFQLTEYADRKCKTYSGGQRRRVDIALGIIHEPKVVFLDEPTSGLDPQSRAHMWTEVRRLRDEGMTIFLTTHYLEEADALADRVVVIDRGRVVAEGAAAAIKARVGRKRVRFTTPQRVELALFDGLPVEGLGTEDGVTRLLTPRPEEVLKRLFESGTRVSDLEVVGADLEEGRNEEEGLP